MIGLQLAKPKSGALSILCLGAHSDDIEIGCGSTILRLTEEYPECKLHWCVLSALGLRSEEASRSAQLFAGKHLAGEPILKGFRDGFLPYSGGEVKSLFEQLKTTISPDLIFTHYGKDAHQDHRLISELTWNTFRDHLILEYEIPKYDGDLGRPSVFFPVRGETAQLKVKQLMEAFPSQCSKQWFQPETFLGLMRLRGMECNAPSGYAEAFYARKIVL